MAKHEKKYFDDEDFSDNENYDFVADFDNNQFEKIAVKRKLTKGKKARRVREKLYDYFEKKSLKERNWDFDHEYDY